MSYDPKFSVVACWHSKRRLISLVKTSLVCYGGIKVFFCLPSSTHQTWSLTNSWPCGYFPCALLKNVGLTEQVHAALKSRLLKMECQVGSWLFWSCVKTAYSCILFIHLLSLEKHHWLAGNVLVFVPHLCDSAGTICSLAENSPAGSPLPSHLLKLPKSRDCKNLIQELSV